MRIQRASETTSTRRGQPVPPIFQPEVAADAIVWTADHGRREVYVGFPTVAAIVLNKLAPGAGDWYLARTGVLHAAAPVRGMEVLHFPALRLLGVLVLATGLTRALATTHGRTAARRTNRVPKARTPHPCRSGAADLGSLQILVILHVRGA